MSRRPPRPWVGCLVALAMCGASSCAPVVGAGRSDVVHITSPYDRYDHNRARPVIFAGLGETTARRVDTADYIPFGSDRFPSGAVVPQAPARDRLDAVNLAPVFTGVPLPLSMVSVGASPNDRDDLLDFLAAGPAAGVGVKRPGIAGDLPEAVRDRYKAILELLESADLLADGRARVIEWANARKIPWTGKVVDSRYREESVAQLIALRHEAYWFVLFGFPDNPGFTRLVVVPIQPRTQDFDSKEPTAPRPLR